MVTDQAWYLLILASIDVCVIFLSFPFRHIEKNECVIIYTCKYVTFHMFEDLAFINAPTIMLCSLNTKYANLAPKNVF